MSELHVWAIHAAIGGAEDAALLTCPRCGETQIRYVETTVTRSAIDIRFVCSLCEQQMSMNFDLGRMQTRATWEWLR